MSKPNFQLNLISAEKSLFSGAVEEATFPGITGRFGVYPDHAALISPLKGGEIVYRVAGKEEHLTVTAGIVEVLDNIVTACVERAK